MHWSVLGLFVSLLGTGLLPHFGRDPLESTLPVEASGDIRFTVDGARFQEGGAPALDLYLTIPSASLGTSGDSAAVLVSVQLLNGKGKPLARYERDMRLGPPPVPSPGESPRAEQWVRLRPAWVAGCVGVRVRVEDLTRFKSGLADRARSMHRFGEASARFAPAALGAAPPRLVSDLYFAWGQSGGADSSAASALQRQPRDRLQPNPLRYYGLYQNLVTVYWEEYPDPDAVNPTPGQRLIQEESIIRLADSVEVHAAVETSRVESPRRWVVRRFDVASLPAGSYRFRVSLRDPDRSGAVPLARTEGDFQVVWERENWVLTDDMLLSWGRILLSSEEFERYSALDRGGMEFYLRRLWGRSESEVSAKESEFKDRIRHANEEFPGLRPGMLSDRGLIYVRYGPPEEVRRQLNPQDEELLYVTLPQEVADDGIESQRTRHNLSSPHGRWDNSAYEIWEYFTRGDPLFPQFVNPGGKTGLKFIFVDGLGNGDYSLTYSNVPGSVR